MSRRSVLARLLLVALVATVVGCSTQPQEKFDPPVRQEVIFWHFWGGRDRSVVADVVRRFNASQRQYRVRAVAMPGNNLDLKFFLSVAGGDPPDLLNQDDPIVADWAHRGALLSLDELAPREGIREVRQWLLPAAQKLAEYEDRLYALPNGLDIRALYFNATWLEELQLPPPRTIADLDQLSEAVATRELATGREGRLDRVGYLPDPRRIWAWGVVFGGRFRDPLAATSADSITADCPENLAALKWMASYRDRFGAEAIASFRTGDQALTGSSFPLLSGRRYAAIMDGQWRVRDIADHMAEQSSTKSADQYGVVPLPAPAGGRERAGWVNGNFFVVPRGARQPEGAWAFMKFWVGLDGNQTEAAKTCAAGGWIPVSEQVIREPAYQHMLKRQPMMQTFVDLARSEHQHPTPPLTRGVVLPARGDRRRAGCHVP